MVSLLFFFNDTATTEIYTLSLHDALPICTHASAAGRDRAARVALTHRAPRRPDRKSTRLNSSHGYISYAVFCLKKKIAGLLPNAWLSATMISQACYALHRNRGLQLMRSSP